MLGVAFSVMVRGRPNRDEEGPSAAGAASHLDQAPAAQFRRIRRRPASHKVVGRPHFSFDVVMSYFTHFTQTITGVEGPRAYRIRDHQDP